MKIEEAIQELTDMCDIVRCDNYYSLENDDIEAIDTVLKELDRLNKLIEPECISSVGKTSEPTDNATEKIEELDKEEMLCLTLQCAIAVLTDKLNEVIRYINKEVK